MIRSLTVLLFFTSLGLCQTTGAEELTVVTSWEHYRDLMIEDGKTDTEADRRIAELLGSLNDMDRSAGADRIGVGLSVDDVGNGHAGPGGDEAPGE